MQPRSVSLVFSSHRAWGQPQPRVCVISSIVMAEMHRMQRSVEAKGKMAQSDDPSNVIHGVI